MQNAAQDTESDALPALARDLLTRLPGDRLPTVGQYQAQFGVGSGTIQSRLRQLVEARAIQVAARGHEGTFLIDRDVTRLWSAARLGSLRGALPLPEAFEPVALAVLLRRRFGELRIPLELVYLHGSAGRIDLVARGEADFAIVSKPSVEEAIASDRAAWLTVDLGPGSYHCEDSIVVLMRPHLGTDDRITRIGVDVACTDHLALTQAEFPADQGYVHSAHTHARLPAAVAEGTIDAAIWLRTTPIIPLSAVGIAVRPLHRPDAIAANRALSSGVIVARADRPEVGTAIRMLDLSSIRQIQDEIRRADALPLY